MSIKPNWNESLTFLKRFHPGRLWVLSAIPSTQAKITTRTFREEDADQVLQWLYANEQNNIYFSVAEPAKFLSKKAERTDIKAVHWLHVDVDPRAGEDVEQERERILHMLKSPPDGIPVPTVIVFSGGGYQGFWRLEEPIEIDGKLDLAEQAKLYNIQLELLLGGDQCHNIDRIMRLPGSINWPNKRKVEKGRVPALAKIIPASGKTYPLDKFIAAPQVQNGKTFESRQQVKISGNVKRIDDLDTLPLTDLCKVVIVQGCDPDDPTKFQKKDSPGELDRSNAVWYVICEMVRCGCSNNDIFSVITDPGFGISEHVLAQKTNVEKFAARQIERARDMTQEDGDLLTQMNDRYAVIGNYGGKCRILTERDDVLDGVRRKSVDFLSFADFKNFWCNKLVEVGMDQKTGKPIYIPVGKWWIQHEDRREYNTVVFAPQMNIEGSYNLWKGFAFDAIPGDCSIYLDHVYRNICGSDDVIYKYLVGWMATAVQHPDRPGQVAVVLKGRQGTGKGMFAENFGALFGRHFLPIRNSSHIFGQFNSHLRDCVVLFADEAIWSGNNKHESLLKSLITQDTVMSEAKGFDAEPSRNFIHLIMASNDDWVVPARGDDRRMLVLEVEEHNKRDTDFFGAMADQLENGGYEALLHFLRTYDLTDFVLQEIPQTQALIDQKVQTFDTIESWWYEKLEQGRMFDEDDGWPEEVFSSHLCYDYINYSKLWGGSGKLNKTKMGRFFNKVFPSDWESRGQKRGKHHVIGIDGIARDQNRPYVYRIPPLDKCRKRWDFLYGGPFNWSKDSKDENEKI
jgi:hypothetical protein